MPKNNKDRDTVRVEAVEDRLRLRWSYAGNRHSMALGYADTAANRGFAQLKAAQIQRDIEYGEFDPSLKKYRSKRDVLGIKTPALFERFMAYQVEFKRLEAGSIRRYSSAKANLEKFFDKSAENVTERQVYDFVAVLKERVSDRTVKEYLILYKACWLWAKDERFIEFEKNHWASALAVLKVSPIQKVQPFTLDEVQRIIQAFRVSSYYKGYTDFVVFLFGTGVRPGEATALQWKHFSNDFLLVWVGEALSNGKRKATKTNKARQFTLSPAIAQMLRDRHALMRPKAEDLVFAAPLGKPINIANFGRRAWTKVLEQCGIDRRKFYATRHTAGSHAAEQPGANHLAIAQALGHSPQIFYKNYASVIEQKSVFVKF
jgi:integrase